MINILVSLLQKIYCMKKASRGKAGKKPIWLLALIVLLIIAMLLRTFKPVNKMQRDSVSDTTLTR
jgi:hypothetical protein